MRQIAFLLCLLVVPVAVSASPCCSLGDVNGSGSVSTLDLIKLSEYCQGLTALTVSQLNNANVDGDNDPCSNLDANNESDDLKLIRSYILGTIQTFPRCGDLNENGVLEWDSANTADDDDYLIMQQHILGVTPITDNTTKRNADANQSCTLTTMDSIQIRKLELGSTTTLTNCQSQSTCF